MKNSQFVSKLAIAKNFIGGWLVFGERIEELTRISPTLFGTKSNLKGLPLTSKAASCYFGRNKWNWMKEKEPWFAKTIVDTNNEAFT